MKENGPVSTVSSIAVSEARLFARTLRCTKSNRRGEVVVMKSFECKYSVGVPHFAEKHSHPRKRGGTIYRPRSSQSATPQQPTIQLHSIRLLSCIIGNEPNPNDQFPTTRFDRRATGRDILISNNGFPQNAVRSSAAAGYCKPGIQARDARPLAELYDFCTCCCSCAPGEPARLRNPGGQGNIVRGT